MMSDNLTNWKKKLHTWIHDKYVHPTCDYCKNELFMSYNEAELTLFEPKEAEFEAIKFEHVDNVLREKTVKYKEIVSSDPLKDTYTFKCPYCGHIFKMTRAELKELECSFYGDNRIRFELDDEESAAAREFMKEHNHKEEFRKQGKMGFSTLGMQFTYEIIPGGLGPLVSIKCNHCGKSKDITNTKNW